MNKQTPSQTIGPFFAVGLTDSRDHIPYTGSVTSTLSGAGEGITINGKVFDGSGEPINDAMLEILQSDGAGGLGLARSETGASPDASFSFQTVKPGPLSAGEAPYIAVVVHLRGLLIQAYTRIYFADEMELNLEDPVFSNLPEDRRDTLIAARTPDQGRYEFNIHMQGDHETLFFQV